MLITLLQHIVDMLTAGKLLSPFFIFCCFGVPLCR